MNVPRTLLRWLPTFLAFPVGGLAALALVGPVDSTITALLAGLVAGAVVGLGQWLALRGRGVGALWIPLTSAGMGVGAGIAAVVTGTSTTTAALTVTGAVTGAVVGLAQSNALRRGVGARSVWVAVVALAWAAAWWTTAHVIVDAERGWAVFGSSGAVLATVLTGLVLPRVLPVADVEVVALETADAR
ncbi:MAG: hypothetical protein U0R68_08785 [Candidatus Nanopelagicales bacterium]